ncbi:MAG: hypothetical protein QM817_30230 [Archangium sp.]
MTAPFAWHATAPVFVTADENLVLGYDSADQGPTWLTPAPSKVLQVVMSADRVHALCEGGVILELALKNGEKLSSQTVEGARDIVLTSSGALAIVTAQGVMFEATTLNVPDAVHAAFSGDGRQAVVVNGQGVLKLFELPGATEVRSLAIDQPAKATLAYWNPLGPCWLVIAGTHVKNVKADLTGLDIFVSFESPFGALAVERTGRIVAARAGKSALVIGFPKRESISSLTYFEDKNPGGVGFGPGSWVGVAIGNGDANTVDMTQEGVCRSDPHPGRVRNRWMLSVSVKPAAYQQVLARPGAGGVAATSAPPPPSGWVGPSQPAAPSAPPASPASAAPNNTLKVVGIVIAALVALCLACTILGSFAK